MRRDGARRALDGAKGSLDGDMTEHNDVGKVTKFRERLGLIEVVCEDRVAMATALYDFKDDAFNARPDVDPGVV